MTSYHSSVSSIFRGHVKLFHPHHHVHVLRLRRYRAAHAEVFVVEKISDQAAVGEWDKNLYMNAYLARKTKTTVFFFVKSAPQLLTVDTCIWGARGGG